jgi:hypothetical protein
MTWKSDMLDALDDETLHDVRLLGTDNVEIAFTKFIVSVSTTALQF